MDPYKYTTLWQDDMYDEEDAPLHRLYVITFPSYGHFHPGPTGTVVFKAVNLIGVLAAHERYRLSTEVIEQHRTKIVTEVKINPGTKITVGPDQNIHAEEVVAMGPPVELESLPIFRDPDLLPKACMYEWKNYFVARQEVRTRGSLVAAIRQDPTTLRFVFHTPEIVDAAIEAGYDDYGNCGLQYIKDASITNARLERFIDLHEYLFGVPKHRRTRDLCMRAVHKAPGNVADVPRNARWFREVMDEALRLDPRSAFACQDQCSDEALAEQIRANPDDIALDLLHRERRTKKLFELCKKHILRSMGETGDPKTRHCTRLAREAFLGGENVEFSDGSAPIIPDRDYPLLEG